MRRRAESASALFFKGLNNYSLPPKLVGTSPRTIYRQVENHTYLNNPGTRRYFSTKLKSLFLTRSYSSTVKSTLVDNSIPVVKTLQAPPHGGGGEQAQIVLNKMYSYSSGDLKSFLDEHVMHLLDSKYLVKSNFLLNGINELKSVKDSVALGA